MKNFLAFIILLIVPFALFSIHCSKTNSSGSQTKKYKLIHISANADFDYTFIKNIDSIEPPYPAGSRFQIGDLKLKKGRYTIYTFIAEYRGMGSQSDNQTFHDLLKIKTNRERKIIDAFSYTLEWSDSPSLDLYRLTGKGLSLRKNITVKAFKLKNRYGTLMSDSGVIEKIAE